MKGIFPMLNKVFTDHQVCETIGNQQNYQLKSLSRGSKECRLKNLEYLNNSGWTEKEVEHKKEYLNTEFTIKRLELLKDQATTNN